MSDDELSDGVERAARGLRSSARVCVLTGAGVSAESGVPTFRASDGLWEGHRIEDVASPIGWDRNPALVWRFYNARRANVATVKPNPGHFALAEMEKRWGDRFTLVTQNVDGLHLDAGSRNVLEIHGSLRQTRCLGCGTVADRGLEPLDDAPACPHCGGRLRPHIVWFGEGLDDAVWNQATRAADECDALLVVGTSAVVYPAASLVPVARRRGATVIEVNLTRTEASDSADIGLYGPSGVTLPKLLQRLC
ncbi:MAG: SIR2 family NAD-dependent protein deacylase [Gemmata sp.]